MLANFAHDMDYKSLKLLMSAGDLVYCELVPAPMKSGWYIQFQRKNGQVITMQTARGEDKRFGKLVTAANWARDIGFQKFSVYMPENPRTVNAPKSEDFELDE